MAELAMKAGSVRTKDTVAGELAQGSTHNMEMAPDGAYDLA